MTYRCINEFGGVAGRKFTCFVKIGVAFASCSCDACVLRQKAVLLQHKAGTLACTGSVPTV